MSRIRARFTSIARISPEIWYGKIRHALTTLVLITGLAVIIPSPALSAENASPMLLSTIMTQQSSQLATIDSDQTAVALFVTTIGPSLGLKDAAGAAASKRLPNKLAQELRVAELSQSISELMAALAVWQFADSISHSATDSVSVIPFPAAAKREWLLTRSQVQSLTDLLSLAQERQTQPKPLDLRIAAAQTALDASQRATAAWWDVYGWKDRIRQAKGQARLCGTWQWIVHNHQMHGEQKAVMIFPPAGQTAANSPVPTEMIFLGDAIYLRWEQAGHIQEDSLLFIKDNSKIEGSFMNNTGGWGPISGKRLAACQP